LVEGGKMFNRHFSTVILAEKKVNQHKSSVKDTLESLNEHIDNYANSNKT